MVKAAGVVLGAIAVIAASGCRITTHVKEVARVDLAVENHGGNRGYLVGTPPAPKAAKTTRQMVETLIELPAFGSAKNPTAPTAKVAESEAIDTWTEQAWAEYPPIDTAGFTTPDQYDTYVVQKGDSLWSIAAQSGVYGKATLWRSIYEANRDQLKNPDSLKTGMELKIPRSETAGSETTYDDLGSVFKK